MTAVTVSNQNIRLDDAEVVGTVWSNILGGQGGALETDFFYQNQNCFARKGGTASRGIYLSDQVDSDLSGAGTYETVLFKFICTTPQLLDLLSVPGMQLFIGSGSTQAADSVDFHTYDVQGRDTYPISGSWLVLPINPNIVAHRSGTVGSPNLTLVDTYGLNYDQTGTSKSPNNGMDAVDIGNGLTLIGGDGGDDDGLWADFVFHDFGTVANRFGYVRTVEGVILLFGMMVIGTATATVFNDLAQTLIFTEGLFAKGWSGITVDLQNATTDVDFETTNFLANGTKAGEDTRPVLTVTGTSGDFQALTCVFDNFGIITLTSAVTLQDCTVKNSESIIQVGAILNGCIFTGDTRTNIIGAVKVFDDSLAAFEDETTDANDVGDSDWEIFGTLTEAIEDYVAIGFLNKFAAVEFDNLNGVAGIDGGSLATVWEYWNGTAWASLAGVTDGTASGGLAFTAAVADGQSLTFTEPTDWAPLVLDSSAPLFYIRLRITAGDYSTNPVYDQGFIGDDDDVAFITATDPGLIDDCDFTFNIRGHAIRATAAGTYAMDGNVFTGYGAADTIDAAFFNDSGGLITLNITNGLNPTVKNGAGASTVINNNITATVTVKDAGGAVIVGARVSVRLDSDNSEILGGVTDGSGIVSGTVAASAGAVNVRVRKGSGGGTDYIPVRSPQTVGAGDFGVTISMAEDPLNAT